MTFYSEEFYSIYRRILVLTKIKQQRALKTSMRFYVRKILFSDYSRITRPWHSTAIYINQRQKKNWRTREDFSGTRSTFPNLLHIH
jgi:hypothetical protein